MTELDQPTVWVRRQWNDWRRALYPAADLERVHWSVLSGGVQAPAPRPFLHGYVQCDRMLEGELAHSGAHGGDCPHRIKVCIVKKDNTPAIFRTLQDRAGESSPLGR